MDIKTVDGKIIYKSDTAKTLVDLLHEAARNNVDLSRANLEKADLKGLKIGE